VQQLGNAAVCRGLGIDDLIHWSAATSSIISGIEAYLSGKQAI
jgi:hypothetical protein